MKILKTVRAQSVMAFPEVWDKEAELKKDGEGKIEDVSKKN